ncbi:hypothetical protein RvY_16776 [Ramazzottius varieornatus]|uniref:SOCS box domain-containing protein n=1 Tax=Ramazzottius varieornatus TaxID=947166 RepID=A0A1D1W0E5_RAMVA|nr:hypothetical protein RvY_16776 [Ramazzottius varieornatus]
MWQETSASLASLRMAIPSSAPTIDTADTISFSLAFTTLHFPPTSTPPLARSGHRICIDNGNLYSFGGFNSTCRSTNNGLFPELWKLNLATQRWTLLSSGSPLEAASHTMVLQDSCLLIFGGTGYPWGQRLSNTIHVFHIPSAAWTGLQCLGDIPTPRYGHSMSLTSDGMFVLGGTTGSQYNMQVYRLDVTDLLWRDVTPRLSLTPHTDLTVVSQTFPPPRYRHEVVEWNDHLLMFGGGAGPQIFGFGEIWAFSIKLTTWTKVKCHPCDRCKKYPIPRKFHAVVQYGNYAYLCGGLTATKILDDFWRLHLPTLQWRRMEDRLPQPLYFHAAAVTPAGCLYVFGGVVRTGQEKRTNDVCKKWLVVPSLQEMVWDVLVKKHSESFAHRHFSPLLKKSGMCLPLKFLQRINVPSSSTSKKSSSPKPA